MTRKVIFYNGYFMEQWRGSHGHTSIKVPDPQIENAKEIIKQMEDWIEKKEAEKRRKKAVKSFYGGIKKW